MTATGAPGNISAMPLTEKNAATLARATAATRAPAPLARSVVAATASGAMDAAETAGDALAASCWPFALVRLRDRWSRLRSFADKDALPDDSTVDFSTVIVSLSCPNFTAFPTPLCKVWGVSTALAMEQVIQHPISSKRWPLRLSCRLRCTDAFIAGETKRPVAKVLARDFDPICKVDAWRALA
jgi:hypothetical protein